MKVRYTCGCRPRSFIYDIVNPQEVDAEGWIECAFPLSRFVGSPNMYCKECGKTLVEEIKGEAG